jgi:hypothetical protein
MYKISWTFPKFIYGIGGAIASLTYGIQSAMLGLLICIAADTITGLVAAPYRNQRRNSTSLRKVVPKMITYLSAGLLAHVCEMLVFPTWASGSLELGRIIFSFFAGIEIMSCFENLKDITGSKAFDLLTLNFKNQIEQKVGVKLPKKTIDKNNNN